MAERRAEIGWIERLIALRSFPGWADLPASELAAISAAARPRLCAAGERLVDARSVVSSVLLVVDGELVVTREGRALGRIGPRDWLGAVLAFAPDALGIECDAAVASLVLELDVDDLEDIFEDRVGVLARAVAVLSREAIALRRAFPEDGGFVETDPSREDVPARPLDVVERVFYLRQSRALPRARIDATTALAEAARELRVEAGEPLFRIGDPSGAMIAVIGGRVDARSADGQRFTFGAGDMIGGLDTFAGVPRWYEAEAATALTALVLDRDEILDVWEDHPDLGIAMLRAVSTSLLDLLGRRPRTA
ncbi:MAG: cyclic nucleotide-binding domain-containing protein [Sandaracinaceae bacterium]|nr:cyclic nucleotide-binding domain-containing protein [Sandaracinaceae bacterium]